MTSSLAAQDPGDLEQEVRKGAQVAGHLLNWWVLGRIFALGILSFLIFLILGQVLVLTIAQEGEGSVSVF